MLSRQCTLLAKLYSLLAESVTSMTGFSDVKTLADRLLLYLYWTSPEERHCTLVQYPVIEASFKACISSH